MEVNRGYKDSVFTLLFNNEERLLELYNAIEGTNYTDAGDIKINTLRDIIFLDKVNDVSFEFRKKQIVLIEHQSTINPNMALRLLMYIGR
ncbi:MAG: Rpn family recombination-promoting nuclease/putative transposase, partial [Spirochaetaceae bacterium]|nr:Rpn family recombination-promoting nuclease/putative transposase [Spirochaetaceae bacterium]